MLPQFLRYINEKHLIESPQKTLLAVSGGLDSVVMVHLFVKAGYDFGIAHCNFQLRGEDADGDEDFVRNIAQELNKPFFSTRFDTKNFAKMAGISTQMAARELRYVWFEEMRQQNGYDFIATAHHQDDNLETLLINLVRGTGLAGLHGILPKSQNLIRPLLFASRADLAQYVEVNKLTWREDASNQSSDYHRNLLRLEVVPILKKMNPNLTDSTKRFTDRMADVEQIVAESMTTVAREVVINTADSVELYYQKLNDMPAPKERLYYFLKPFGYQYHQAVAIWEARNTAIGKQFFSETHLLTKDRERFIITPKSIGNVVEIRIEATDSVIEWGSRQLIVKILGDKQIVQIVYLAQVSVSSQTPVNSTIFIRFERLVFPLKWRKWKAGDWFCPSGMDGKRKKISDFLIDQKIPRALKDQVYVLESDSKIVWVVGHRADERFVAKQD